MPKILVIDDEPDILEMIRSHFSIRGYEVLTASDGTEGMQLLESAEPDVVLLDLKMKRVDGDRFLQGIREKNFSGKILVITGYQDEALRRKVEELGVDGYLEKPASLLDLQRKIQELTAVRS